MSTTSGLFKAVILAGGDGSRLYPITDRVPKSLLPIANRPLLAYQLELLEAAGFKDVIVLTSEPLLAAIREFLARSYRGKLQVDLASSPPDVGTGHAILSLKEKLQKSDFVVLPGDLIGEPGNFLHGMAEVHRTQDATATVLLTEAVSHTSGDSTAATGGGAKQKGASKSKDTKSDSAAQDDPSRCVVALEAGRRLLYFAPLDVFRGRATLTLPKTLLRRHPRLAFSPLLSDPHVYMFSPAVWPVWEEKRKRKHLSLREDLLPLLVRQQWQPSDTEDPSVSSVPATAAAITNSDVSTVPTTSGNTAGVRAVHSGSIRAALVASLSTVPLSPAPLAPPAASSSTASASLPADDVSLLPYELTTSYRAVDRLAELRGGGLRCYAHVHSVSTPPPFDPATAATASTTAALSLPLCRRSNTLTAYLELNRLLVPILTGGGQQQQPRANAATTMTFNAEQMGEMRPTGSLVGGNSRVGERTSLRFAVIGRNCTLGAGCRLLNCVLMDNVTLADGCVVISSVLGPGVSLAERCMLKDSQIGAGVRVPAGSALSNEQLSGRDEEPGETVPRLAESGGSSNSELEMGARLVAGRLPAHRSENDDDDNDEARAGEVAEDDEQEDEDEDE